jgi:hypothetical protein
MPEHSNYPPTSDYAFLSDCHSAGLVSRGGSVDWLSMPRFDSGSGVGQLLDRKRGGFCSIFPNTGMAARRHKILERLNAFDAGPTEDDRRAERPATIRRAIEAAQDLKWGWLSADIAGAYRIGSPLIAGCGRKCNPLGTTRRKPERHPCRRFWCFWPHRTFSYAGCCFRTSGTLPSTHSGE